jgi:trk system potassium uptake protein TrkH
MSSAPLILSCLSVGNNALPPAWRLLTAVFAAITCLLTAFFLLRRILLGKIFAATALAASVATAFPYFVVNPFAALIGAVIVIGAGFALIDFRIRVDEEQRTTHADRCHQRARWSSLTLLLLVIAALLVNPAGHILSDLAITTAAIMNQALFIHWALNQKKRAQIFLRLTLSVLILAGIVLSFIGGYIRFAAIIFGILTFIFLPESAQVADRPEYWWEPFFNHPARVLISTFLGLCVLGTFLLRLPEVARLNPIAAIDAAFTSVSAVCVTGLIVLDTPKVFSPFGQFVILVLIQLGGLGIMTITTVALHAMGRRLSLRHERILTTITETNRNDLVASLVTILRFTFVAEVIGALFLTALFFRLGDPMRQAVWRGIFTSVSAFCNAGFALQSDSLISYRNSPLILYTVSLLIIFGGMAPATSLIIPRWIRKRPIPVAARITLLTTLMLLFSGTIFILILEWNGALSGFSIIDKLHNAWFQSVTLRTAGFNSININGVISPTFLIMLSFMFIGGSPGGTAGGVKTTTVGILAMTFWSSIMGRNEVLAQNRRISPATINRAVTIICSGAVVWFIMVLMLEITQQIPARQIIFEVTSALGTVGLSTGATSHLDGIGKIIIIITMFVGRIGPITLFMLLSEDRSVRHTRCPDAPINLT